MMKISIKNCLNKHIIQFTTLNACISFSSESAPRINQLVRKDSQRVSIFSQPRTTSSKWSQDVHRWFAGYVSVWSTKDGQKMMREILKVLKRDPLSIQITNYISKLYHIKLSHVLISYPFHSTSTINYYLKQLIIFISFMHLWKNYIIIRVKCYQKKVQKYAARNVQNIFQTNISD